MLYLPGVALDYSIYTNYDNREKTVKLFSDFTPTEQAFHKMGNTIQWQVYQTALRHVAAAEHIKFTVDADDWPPIKLPKSD